MRLPVEVKQYIDVPNFRKRLFVITILFLEFLESEKSGNISESCDVSDSDSYEGATDDNNSKHFQISDSSSSDSGDSSDEDELPSLQNEEIYPGASNVFRIFIHDLSFESASRFDRCLYFRPFILIFKNFPYTKQNF